MISTNPEQHAIIIDEIERIRFRVNRFLIMPKHEEWLRREAFVRQAYSSTMIENASISEEERAKAESELTVERPDVANYARALEFVDFMSSHTGFVLDELFIRQIHWLLMHGTHDSHFLPGEYRKDTNWIEDGGVKVYEPPHQVDVPIQMRTLVTLLRESKLHDILVAGMAHLHLVAIHPFVDGNGRTARLLATALLQSSGWGFRNLLSLDAYSQRNRDSYIFALKATLGARFSDDYDATPWLKHFCESVLVEARQLESRLTEWQMLVDAVHLELRPIGLMDRQIDGYIYASRRNEITRREYIEVTGVSPLTATRDLAVLVTKGIMKPIGKGRGRIYKLTEGAIPKPQPQDRQSEQLELLTDR